MVLATLAIQGRNVGSLIGEQEAHGFTDAGTTSIRYNSPWRFAPAPIALYSLARSRPKRAWPYNSLPVLLTRRRQIPRHKNNTPTNRHNNRTETVRISLVEKSIVTTSEETL